MLETFASGVRVHTMTHGTFPINIFEVMFFFFFSKQELTSLFFVTDRNTYIFDNDIIAAVLYSQRKRLSISLLCNSKHKRNSGNHKLKHGSRENYGKALKSILPSEGFSEETLK